MSGRPEIRVSPSRVALFLLAIAALLLMAHVVAYVVDEAAGAPGRVTATWLFQEEGNIPTWFSSLLLALVGGGLALIGTLKYQERSGDYWQWFALALVPLTLSVDETAQLHEALDDPLSGLGGPLHYAWIVVYVPIVLTVSILFIPFLLRLPGRTLVLLAAGAGTTFCGGVIFEMLEGWWVDAHGEGNSAVLFLLVTTQEMLEMIGSIIAVYALIDYVAGYRPEVTFQVERDEILFAREAERPSPGQSRA